jgi:hypothetical protein
MKDDGLLADILIRLHGLIGLLLWFVVGPILLGAVGIALFRFVKWAYSF